MIMGCTEPNTKPSSTEHTPMLRGDCMNGYTTNNKAVSSIAAVTTADSRRRSANNGNTTRTTAAAIAKEPKMEPITEALMPRSCPNTGSTNVCTSQHDDKNQFTSSNRRIMGSRSKCQVLSF